MADEFTARVLALVAQIPEGRVASYGQLAALAGRPRHARLVGRIMSRHTGGRSLPCHRVLRTDGQLSPEDAFGIPGIQRALLRAEGVSFRKNGRVNMAASRWEGP